MAWRPASCRLSPSQFCITENPDFKLYRSLFSSVSRLCLCLLVSWLLPTVSTTHGHSERPGHRELESDVPISGLHWVLSSFLRANSLSWSFATSCCPLSQCNILLLAYSALPGLTTLIYLSGILLLQRTPATQSSVPKGMRPLNHGCQCWDGFEFAAALSVSDLQPWSFSFCRDD